MWPSFPGRRQPPRSPRPPRKSRCLLGVLGVLGGQTSNRYNRRSVRNGEGDSKRKREVRGAVKPIIGARLLSREAQRKVRLTVAFALVAVVVLAPDSGHVQA